MITFTKNSDEYFLNFLKGMKEIIFTDKIEKKLNYQVNCTFK